MNDGTTRMQVAWPKAGRAIVGLVVANVVFYVLELILLRADVSFVGDLMLRPSDVFEHGKIWQPFTYVWLHDPQQVSHLLFNMLMLWMFGSQIEEWWGARRFLFAYGVFAIGGGVLTLLAGLLATVDPFSSFMGRLWTSPHLGASGAVMGVTIAWGIVFASREFNFLFLGRMTGKTMVYAIVAIQILVALSLEPVSSTSHFGGMIAAFVLCKGLWRPSKLKRGVGRAMLLEKKKKLERELRVIDGGKGRDDDDKKKWN